MLVSRKGYPIKKEIMKALSRDYGDDIDQEDSPPVKV